MAPADLRRNVSCEHVSVEHELLALLERKAKIDEGVMYCARLDT